MALIRDACPDCCACVECLKSRLAEAGFEPGNEASAVDESTVPEPVIRSLQREHAFWSTVVLLRESSATLHSLLPFPGCPRCGSRQEDLRPSRKLPAEWLRDPLTGITSCLRFEDPKTDASLLCCAATGRVHLPLAAPGEYSQGTGPNRRSTQIRQLGEAVERYSAFHTVASRLVRACAKELDGRIAPLAHYCGYNPRQRARGGYVELRRTDKLNWIEGRSVAAAAVSFVPAAMVYFHQTWDPGEPRFAALTSTGTACGRTPESARSRAQLEIVERHITLRAWNSGCFGRLLAQDLLPPAARDIAARARALGVEIVLRELSRPDETPVAIAAVAGPRFPWISVGSAAALESGDACGKALEEAAFAWHALGEFRGEPPSHREIGPVTRPSNHLLFFARRERAQRLLRLLKAGPAARRTRRISSSRVREQLLTLSPHAVEIDLTPPDCRACGFHVLKVVAPGLPTLAFGTLGAPARHLARFGIPQTRKLHPFG